MALTKGGRIRGGNQIIKNLRKEIRLIDGDLSDGLRLAAAHILGLAKEVAPIEFGILRNSGFSDVARIGKKILARVGFTAEYAPRVHETPMINDGVKRSGNRKGHYWQGGENKFLEKAIKWSSQDVLSIIRRKAKR